MKNIILSTTLFLALTALGFSEETIGQITKDQVGKTVKLSGSIESFSPSKSEKAPASFKLKDSAGGSIRVAIWPDVFSQITARDEIKPGAKVEVSAKVSEFRGSLELHIDAAKDLKVGSGASPAAADTPAAATSTKPAESPSASVPATPTAAAPAAPGSGISSITKDKVKETVSITGTVESFTPSRSERAPASFNLKDDTGSIRVAIWPDVFNVIAGKDDIKPGAKVTVKAAVSEFRGNIELHVDSASNVQINGAAAASPAAASTPASTEAPKTATSASPAGKSGISGLKEKVKQKVTITGSVAKARKPSSDTAPYILNIQGDDGAVDVVFWQALADQLKPDQKPNIGDNVEISGEVAEYRGNIQVKPGTPADIKIVKGGSSAEGSSAAATPAPATEMTLSQVATAPAHQRIKVSGTIENVESVHTGKRVTIKDVSGSAILLIWDTAEGGKLDLHALKPGAKITVAAAVEKDDGKPVLTVSKPEDTISISQ